VTAAGRAAIPFEAAAATRDVTSGVAPVSLPEGWYILAAGHEIGRGEVVSRDIADREIALFRTASGEIAAFDAHCAHMGCHLRHASVVGERLRCALHFRHIDRSGHFIRPDGSASAEMMQPTYPAEERFGAIFVYIGAGPASRPPAPDIIDEADFLAGPAGEFLTATPWYALIANGCDMEHLLSVHGRALKEPAVVTTPDPHRFRISYRTAVTGRTPADRLMKWMSGNDISASLTVVSGTTMLVQSHAGLVPSVFLLSMCPQRGGGTLVRGIVGLHGRQSSLLDRIKLRLALWLFKSFLAKDFGVLEGLDWRPPAHAHSQGDGFTRQLFDYFHELKAAAPISGRGLRARES
jgi:nitrite reductase/ring-hydroxylating ferredoxin subunit